MTQIVSIESNTQDGKVLMSLLKKFEDSKSVTFLSNEELDEMEDSTLLKMMEKDRRSGKANTKKVLKKLGIL